MCWLDHSWWNFMSSSWCYTLRRTWTNLKLLKGNQQEWYEKRNMSPVNYLREVEKRRQGRLWKSSSNIQRTSMDMRMLLCYVGVGCKDGTRISEWWRCWEGRFRLLTEGKTFCNDSCPAMEWDAYQNVWVLKQIVNKYLLWLM